MDKETRIRRYAMEYHHRIESHDRKKCRTFTGKGIAMPVTAAERLACLANARGVMKEILERALEEGFYRGNIVQAVALSSNEYEGIGWRAFEASVEWKEIRLERVIWVNSKQLPGGGNGGE